MADMLPSPWDWVPSKDLVLTRSYALTVRFTPASQSARFATTAWELKKTLRALCPPAAPPLLLEASVGKSSAECALVFGDEAAANSVHLALDRQLVAVAKVKYFAEANREPPRGAAAAAADALWLRAFGHHGDAAGAGSLVVTLRQLWGSGKHAKGPGDRPDTLVRARRNIAQPLLSEI